MEPLNIDKLVENTTTMLYRDLIVAELAKHSEVLHKRQFGCVCGEFLVPNTGVEVRAQFLQHRAEVIIDTLRAAGIEGL